MAHLRPRQRVLRSGRRSETRRIYLVTTCTYADRTIFGCLLCGSIVVAEIQRQDALRTTITMAYAVMPDHLHWLLELRSSQSLESVVAQVKGRSALRINKARGRAGRIWQPGFHDRAVRATDQLRRYGDYVIENPVRARLVDRPQDYPLTYASWWHPPDG